jgi:hypothetical protein
MRGPHGIRLFPRIVPVAELGQVAMKVLLPNVVVHPIDAPLQYPKVSLNAVCCDAHAVLVACMPDYTELI